MKVHIFIEFVGSQILLMNTLRPPLRCERTVQDQLTILFPQAQMTKATKVQELLAKHFRRRTQEAMGRRMKFLG
jgi:hypothetical protein